MSKSKSTVQVNVYGRIGSISSGTMLASDLIPAFMDALDSIHDDIITSGGGSTLDDDTTAAARTMLCVALSTRITDTLAAIERSMLDDDGEPIASYFESWEMTHDMEALVNLLTEFCAPYTYFGASDGNGSDYGFWPQWDQIQEDRDSGELASGDSTPDLDDDESVWEEGGLFLTVSDYGNAELYQVEHDQWRSLWSCV